MSNSTSNILTKQT